jgi:predicted nucleic acid-binding protein
VDRPLYYLDTNVLIAIAESPTSLETGQMAFLDKLARGEAAALTSEASLSECLVKPFADNNQHAIDIYLALFSAPSALMVMAITREILIDAARLRARSKMSFPDAVHVSTAHAACCSVFVTEDRRIRLDGPMALSRWSGICP